MNALTALFGKYLHLVQYGRRTRPLRDWLVIASIVFILLIAAASWSYYIFHRTSSGAILGASATVVPAVNTASLDTVMNVFQNRAVERAHYVNDYHFVDPSKQ